MQFEKHQILDSILICYEESNRMRCEVQLVSRTNGSVGIRTCYYKEMVRKDGKRYWNIVPRPLVIAPTYAYKTACAIIELSTKYFRISKASDAERKP